MIALLRKQTVYNLFKEYFGEDRVDMQGNDILVWWPELRISNEIEESCYIKNLYAKVNVENNGSLDGTFTLIRNEYTYDEWVTGYCHSHVVRFSREPESIKMWRDPCLGRGPIRRTCCTLNLGFDEDVWRLFIFELDQYVRHESLEGVPYVRLNLIGTILNSNESIWDIPKVSTIPLKYLEAKHKRAYVRIVNNLVRKIIELKPFGFNYIDNCYGIAESPLNIVIKVSNIFIDWYNTLPREEQDNIKEFVESKYHFRKCKIVNNKIVYNRVNAQDIDYNLELEGTRILTFKGMHKELKITNKPSNDAEFTENYFNLLNPCIVMYVIHKILRTINYRFNGKDKERASRTKEAVRYI